jgi:hypothetical protein
MNQPDQDLELVRDALFGRSVKRVGCFAFNQASDRVREIGPSILPTLERVLRDEVMTVYPSDPKAQVQQFPGVGNLLVDYFRMVKDGHLEHATEFLSSLRGPVLVEAIRAISLVWDHTIPLPFLSTITTVAATGTPEEREIAAWILDWHHNRPRVTGQAKIESAS